MGGTGKSQLYQLLELADSSASARVEILYRLKFLRGPKWLANLRVHIYDFADIYIDPLAAIIITILIFAWKETAARLCFLFLASLIAYLRWLKIQRNNNVKDAMARKDKANSLITENSALLLPYVGSVFDFEARYAEKLLSDVEQTRVDMYVFTEIDNLEYVFDKSRAGLIEDGYVIRAVKIFLARADNVGFARAASRLVKKGRYNEEFKDTVSELLALAKGR